MTILQHAPQPDDLLDFLSQSVRQLADGGLEARFIIMGPRSYTTFCKKLAAELKRGTGDFETWNHIPVVVDPFRDADVCVVPKPDRTASSWQPFRIPQ